MRRKRSKLESSLSSTLLVEERVRERRCKF
jgi:hypothetical protein